MSNHVQITHDLYRWLVQFQTLPNTQKYKPSGNFQLQLQYQQQLQCGYLIAKLFQNIAQQKGIVLNKPLISSIKNSNTPAARVYNWNILNQASMKLGVILSKQKQKQITAGNFDSLVHFLLEIQNKCNIKKTGKSSPQIEDNQQIGVDIKKIKKYQEIQQCDNLLEFMIILISKMLGLTTKQSVSALAESSKYLAHMIVKGIKNSYDEVLSFLSNAKKRMDKIIYLSQKNPQKNIQFLLQVFKPTLISRDVETVKSGLSLLKVLHYQTCKYNTKNIVYQILCKENQGFDFIYMGLKRHPYLNQQIFSFLFTLIQTAMKDFFQIQFKKTINNEQQFLRATILLLQPLLVNQLAKQQIFESGCFALWQKNFDNAVTVKFKGKDIIAINQQTKILYIQLLYTLFLGYYKQIQPNQAEDILIKLIEQLKKNTRSEIYTIRIPSLLKIFDILDFLASNRNKLAALLYKKIIFLLVENHEEDEMRQIVLQNLTIIIRKFPTIPLEFVMEPMLKQLTNKQGSSYILNMFDFEFIIELCKHPKMEQYYAITFLQYFIKLYTKSVIYSALIFRVIQAITDRFCESETIRDYCLKSTDSSLNVYSMLVLGKPKDNKGMHYKDKSLTREQAMINNQKKSLIIEMIKHFIKLEHKQLTQQIKQRVVKLFINWYENRNHYDKGLASILLEIGDIEQLVLEYRKKQEKLQQIEERNKRYQQQSLQSQLNIQNTISRIADKNNINISQYWNKQLIKIYSEHENNNSRLSNSRSRAIKGATAIIQPKNNNNKLNKYQILPIRTLMTKIDPKVLEDIEKIKEKWKLEQSRAKLEQLQKKTTKLNEKQLLQRNISLGYSKLPQLINQQILFQYDSVKKRHLKGTLDLINFEFEQTREQRSFLNIIERYEPYIKRLFLTYANKSGVMNQNDQGIVISFTQVMRLLKEKKLLVKIPKIAINQIICVINSKRKKLKNVLSGIYQGDFNTFLLYFTDLIMQQNINNKKDEPFGLKVQKVLLKLLQGENNVKQLFDLRIQKIKQDLSYDENIEIPADYKKIRQIQTQLNYTIKNKIHFNIKSSFVACYELLDGIVYEAIGVHIISPFTDFVPKMTLSRGGKSAIKAQSQSRVRPGTQIEEASNSRSQDMGLTDSYNITSIQVKKISMNNALRKKAQSQEILKKQQNNNNQEKLQKQQKEKKRQIHIKKLKQQITKMREQKKGEQEQKKKKVKEEKQKQKKKQQIHQLYLLENRKKVQQKKEQQQIKKKNQEKIMEEKKNKRKAEIKAKEIQMFQKQKKFIQQKRDKVIEKQKLKLSKQKQQQKFNHSKSHQQLIKQMKFSTTDQQRKEIAIKTSIQNGELKKIIQKNIKNFEDLFETYWNWEKQKLGLKNLAQLFKDFQTSKYILPKDIADIYKSIAKGELMNLNQFIESITKLAYKSQAIQEQIKENGRTSQTERTNENTGEKQNKQIDIKPFKFMLKLLKMNEKNYKQFVIKLKVEKQSK